MSYWFYKARWYFGVFCLLGAAILLMKYSAWLDQMLFGRTKQTQGVAQQPTHAGQQPAVATPLGGVPLSGSTALSAADIRDQLSQAQSLLDEASSNVSNALQGVLTWQTDIEPLLEQDVSRPNSEESDRSETEQTSKLYDRLAYVLRRDRPSPQELRDTASKIDSLQLKVRDLMSQSNPLALSLAQMSDISLLHASSVQAKKDWRRDIEQALAIKHLIATQVQTPVEPPAPATVGNKVRDADAKATVADLDEQIEREEQQAAAQREREAKLAEERRKKEEQAAQLLAEATSPEVKALLAPFLEPRTIQPQLAGTFSIKWVRTFEKQPMSLGKLMEIGALDDSVLGLKKLALVLGNRKLPEPRWSIASQPNNWSPEDEDRLKQAQQMLRDYGPILVQAGLLSN